MNKERIRKGLSKRESREIKRRTIEVEISGYKIDFLVDKKGRIKMISFFCPYNYGDPYIPRPIWKEAYRRAKEIARNYNKK